MPSSHARVRTRLYPTHARITPILPPCSFTTLPTPDPTPPLLVTNSALFCDHFRTVPRPRGRSFVYSTYPHPPHTPYTCPHLLLFWWHVCCITWDDGSVFSLQIPVHADAVQHLPVIERSNVSSACRRRWHHRTTHPHDTTASDLPGSNTRRRCGHTYAAQAYMGRQAGMPMRCLRCLTYVTTPPSTTWMLTLRLVLGWPARSVQFADITTYICMIFNGAESALLLRRCAAAYL